MLDNLSKKAMITNVMKATKMQDVNFSKNVAVVVKETTNKNGEISTTYVEFPHLKDRDAKSVFKCVIIGILSDETITNEMKAEFVNPLNEDGSVYKLGKGETYTPPTFRRLIANFSESYKIGFTDNEGKFTPVHTVTEKQNLRSLLLVNGKKIEEFSKANTNLKRAIVHTLASAAIKQLTKESRYVARYEETATEKAAAKAKKPATKPTEKAAA